MVDVEHSAGTIIYWGLAGGTVYVEVLCWHCLYPVDLMSQNSTFSQGAKG